MSDEAIISGPHTIMGLNGKRVLPPGGMIKLYDFRRPDKFSKEQLRTMQILSEGFARLATTRLSAALRLSCDLALEQVDQMTYEEFMEPLPSPCLLSIASMEPLKGNAIIHIDAAGTDAIVERLFGAAPAASDKPLASSGLTDVEIATLESVSSAVIDELGKSWSFVEGIKPKLTQLETEARFCQIVPPTEMIVLASFKLSIGAVKAKLDIVYPFLMLEPIIGMLSAKYWYNLQSPVEATTGQASARRATMPAEILCDAGSLSITALRSLRKGSTIPVPTFGSGSAWLRLGGARVADLSGVDMDGKTVSAAFEGGAATKPIEPDHEAADPIARLAAELRAGLAAIKDGVSDAMKAMTNRIDELKGGQDDLSDRVLYGQADAEGARQSRRPFSSIAGMQVESLALFLGSERAQLCALVLAFADDAVGARLLSLLPAERQADITRRIVTMGWVSPDILAEIERVLGKKLSAIDKSYMEAGGVAKVVGLLNLSPRDTERRVIESLDSSDPEMAESIKRNMFVFEDIIILDDESIAAVLEVADERDILVAMKPVSEELRERLFSRFPAESRERLKAAFAGIGRTRLSECDAAGARVVETIRVLEKEGRIMVLRQGE